MKNDQLMELLARADEAGASPTLSGDIARRVRKKARRRVKRRAAAGVLASCVACAVLVVTLMRPHPPVQNVGPTAAQVAQIKAEIAAMDSLVLVHQRTAEELRQIEARAATHADLAYLNLPTNGLLQVDEARDRAALLLVREGERAAKRPADGAAARESYLRAARLFPETPAGRVAAGRLGPLGILL
jgi:hypothetical protein